MDNCQCSIKISNLNVVKFNHTILKNISLKANHGEILALIGKNGAGKTTLINSIMYSEKNSQNIMFFDCNNNKIDSPKIGYVPQKLTFDKNIPLTVLDMFCTNSKFLPIWLGHSKKMVAKVKNILSKVGAEKNLYKTIGCLSGGELQRVLLAFALEPRPDILLLDEPVSAIDEKGIDEVYKLITSMRKEYHMPIIIVSHDLRHVYKYATSYALIDHGKILEIQSTNKMYKSPIVQKTFNLSGGIYNK